LGEQETLKLDHQVGTRVRVTNTRHHKLKLTPKRVSTKIKIKVGEQRINIIYFKRNDNAWRWTSCQLGGVGFSSPQQDHIPCGLQRASTSGHALGNCSEFRSEEREGFLRAQSVAEGAETMTRPQF
jgi:hypothetical protein